MRQKRWELWGCQHERCSPSACVLRRWLGWRSHVKRACRGTKGGIHPLVCQSADCAAPRALEAVGCLLE